DLEAAIKQANEELKALRASKRQFDIFGASPFGLDVKPVRAKMGVSADYLPPLSHVDRGQKGFSSFSSASSSASKHTSGPCDFCGYLGHAERDCRIKKAASAEAKKRGFEARKRKKSRRQASQNKGKSSYSSGDKSLTLSGRVSSGPDLGDSHNVE
ncbi:hypothetical protein ADUPG1_002961, partial [Aduncisulcus paluster]